jgi:hypothetical protein
MKDVRGKSQP